jgi:hypothetical protein
LNVHGASDVRQIEILEHTVEPLVLDSTSFEVEITVEIIKM